MLKVFLVEDEYVVREGIKKRIDWNANGYEFCGEASDGELAFPMIQKEKPDIVITDIKMPFMDGLTLSRLIKKEMPWIEIIILTGYEEFEYAKEALKIGVAEYLSKPINGEELLRELDGLRDKIEEKQKEQEIKNKYTQEIEENFLKEKRELFQYLVTASKSTEELLELATKLEMDISSMWYNIVLIQMHSVHHEYSDYSESVVAIEQQMQQLREGIRLHVFDRGLEGKALLFLADSKEELEALQKTYLNKLEELLKSYNHIRYFGGIGEPVNRMRELPSSFEKASHAYAHRYFVSDNQFFRAEDIGQATLTEKEEFDIRNIDPKKIERKKILEFLKTGDQQEVGFFTEEFFRAIGDGAIESMLFRQYIVMDVYFAVSEFLDGLGLSKEEIGTPDMTSMYLQSMDGAQKYVTDILGKALTLREEAASGRYSDVVEKVKQYVEDNYADEELSLNLLASHVNFSPNHLSMIFSQQTGQTFIKYLTDYRMNKAKEMLRCTGKRSSEICMDVGYKDPHYFSYLFKKTQGMTPTQYRGKKNG